MKLAAIAMLASMTMPAPQPESIDTLRLAVKIGYVCGKMATKIGGCYDALSPPPPAKDRTTIFAAVAVGYACAETNISLDECLDVAKLPHDGSP